MHITIITGFFLPVPPVTGGAIEKMWWRLARIYVRKGHQVTIFARSWGNWPDQETIDGIQIRRLRGANQRRSLWQNLVLDAWWGFRILFVLPPADLLITNTVALPVFVRQLRPSAGQLIVNINRYPKGQTKWYGRAVRIQAASGAIAAAVREQSPARTAIVRVVPNSVDCAAFAGPSRTLSAGPVTIGFFGRIHPEKGLQRLVEAAGILAENSSLPPWRIVLRGPTDVARGGGGDAFVARLREHHPRLWAEGRLVLVPALYDPAALAQAYREIDIFCYPTEATEGEAHPVAVLEAMAASLPVVVTNLPCFADQLRHGKNALLVNLRDTAGLSTSLARLILDPNLRRALGEQACQTISTLDDEVVASQHLADYSALLDASLCQ